MNSFPDIYLFKLSCGSYLRSGWSTKKNSRLKCTDMNPFIFVVVGFTAVPKILDRLQLMAG